MKSENDKIYRDKIDEIGDKVYHLYKMGGREDLVMQYNMGDGTIESYIYEAFLNNSNPRSQRMLKEQYAEAKKMGKIVLFIRDEKRRKFKSYTI